MITSNTTFMCACPCCGKPATIRMTEKDDGEILVFLSHMPDASVEDVSKYGIELGIIPSEKGG